MVRRGKMNTAETEKDTELYDKIETHFENQLERTNFWLSFAEAKNGAIIMNMCMVQDDKGNVLALDKVNDSYTGTTFPGGHVEQNEIFQKSIIREVWEETGLTIESPKLCGLYHWHEDGVHSVIMLYKAEKFIGELKSSEEGQVYWIPLEELKTRELATGMKYVLQILGADQVNECYMHLESEGYVGDLY